MGQEKKPNTRFNISTIGFLSAVAGAFSLFSLCSEISDVGLAPVFGDVVEYYRTLGRWLFGWIYIPYIGWPPVWLRDLWILSAVGIGTMMRIGLRVRNRVEAEESVGSIPLFRMAIGFVIGTLLLIGVPLLIGGVLIMFLPVQAPERPIDEANVRDVRAENVIMLGLLLLFFVLNAYGLSID